MKIKLIVVLAIFLFQSCKTQQLQTQTKTSLPKIENQLKGELDYAKGGFELVQWQNSGDEITLGSIDEKGMIHFNLPEYDIRALGKTHMKSDLGGQFNMVLCKGKGEYNIMAEPLFKTPWDDVYSQLYRPMYVKKYGVFIAYVSLVSDEKMLMKGSSNKVIGSYYNWMYIDRDLDYKDTCIREANKDTDLEVERSADIQFKKGWNLIKRNLVAIQNYGENNEHTIPKKILFTIASPQSQDVKWYLEQAIDDEKIQAAKIKYNSAAPITKEQFKKWLPEKGGGFTRTSYELDKALVDSDSKSNNVYLVFENGTQKMEIAILDGAKNPDDLEMAKFSFAMDEEYERDDKPASDATESDTAAKGEVHHISKEDDEKKTAQIMSVFKDRIVLYANAENMTATQLWDAIKTLDVGSIIN